MGTGFAVNGMSVKYSLAYVWGEMVFHLYYLHNIQSFSSDSLPLWLSVLTL